MPHAAPSQSRFYSAALSAIFVLVLSMGLLGAFAPVDAVPSLQELRVLASFPSLGEFRRPTLIPNRITAFFSDNFGARKLLTREYFRVRLKVLRSDLGLPALLGKDGSLILPGELRSSRHLHRIEPQRLERMRVLLDSWCNYAHERGATFVFLIAPNKTTIHPFIPDYLPVANEPSVIDTVYALPFNCPFIKLDLRGPLGREADKLLYYKWGTHWNAHASLIMWREIREAVEREGPRLSWPRATVAVTQQPAYAHVDSMWAWYGLPDPEQIMLNRYAFSGATYTAAANAPPRAKVLALGDSFLFWSRPTAAEIMGTYSAFDLSPEIGLAYTADDLSKDGWVVSAQVAQKRIEIMDDFRPNVVVLEIVERSIEELADIPLAPGAKR